MDRMKACGAFDRGSNPLGRTENKIVRFVRSYDLTPSRMTGRILLGAQNIKELEVRQVIRPDAQSNDWAS